MNTPESTIPAIPNGSGAAALLSAAIGSFVLSVIAFAGDKSVPIKNSLNFYKPTGPLSGVTTIAILVWLLTWVILEWRWRKRSLTINRIIGISIGLLVLSILLTFPPIVDFL